MQPETQRHPTRFFLMVALAAVLTGAFVFFSPVSGYTVSHVPIETWSASYNGPGSANDTSNSVATDSAGNV